jgi:glycosyltransferase involved in cell wall biosynthesis
MKKIRLIYDVYNILVGEKKKQDRTGIYFCSYNILKRLKEHTDIEIFLYTHHKNLISISKKVNILKGLKFSKIHDASVYKKNIKFHLNFITNSDNILLKFIGLFKIIKNTLQIIYINKKQTNMELPYIDVFLSPSQSVPEIITSHSTKKFRLLHDVIPILFPHYYPKGESSLWKDDMSGSLDKETYYFCNSESTKRDFINHFGEYLDENKMNVIYHSSSNEFEPKYNRQAIKYIANKYRLGIEQYKYIFSFCSLEHHKNLIFTVKCFIKFIQDNNINDLYFLLGGGQWNNFIGHFNKTLDELPESCRTKIVHLGYVDDSDVNILYSNSLFFVFLSQYEGFGVPPLEAMKAGTPVIVSNSSSLPEVVGDAAVTIDYDDEEACINAMKAFYFNEDLRQTYIKKGLERSKLFSWDKTVDLITNKIKEVIQYPPGNCMI